MTKYLLSKLNDVSQQVDIALDEILHLQEEGCSDEDVSAVLEIEQRAHENGLQVSLIMPYDFPDIPISALMEEKKKFRSSYYCPNYK